MLLAYVDLSLIEEIDLGTHFEFSGVEEESDS